MRSLFLFCTLAFCLFAQTTFAQFVDFSNDTASPNDQFVPISRSGRVGIGFANFPAYNGVVGTFPPRLLVRDGLLAHYVSGNVGDFAGKWSGLGEGNPGNFPGVPNPYGLSIADNNNVGFFNLFPRPNTTITRDLVVGFGQADANQNTNRFILRSYFGPSASLQKDLLIANPTGAVGINEEPLSTFWVNSTLDLDANRPKAIAITGRQAFGLGSLSSASAMGVQGNSTLVGTVVEGFRAQIPAFPPPPPAVPPVPIVPVGVGVNLQVVKSPGPTTPALASLLEYAELSWQDLKIFDPVSSTICAVNANNQIVAETYNKMFVSFRNGENINPFSAANRLPVMTFQGNGRVGIGTVQPTSGSGCVGGVYSRPILLDVNGAISSSGTLLSSDKRFKQNIKPVEDALSLIRRLQGTTYAFRTEEFKDRNFPQGNQYGFIAQDVEKVMPEMAFENSDGYYVVNYTMLIPVLTEAIKEQDKTIEKQEKVNADQAEIITELRTEVAELRSAFNDFKAGQAPNGTQGYRLEQNAPNPFSQNTMIGYAVPAGTTSARVNVYDLSGRLVKSFNIADQSGQITLNAGELSNGLYIYDLQVNGRQILERKMTVVKD